MPRDRGAAVLLLPVCTLLVVVLGGLTVDHAHAFLAQRELANAVSAAANDAASAIDGPRFYASGVVLLDPAAATARAHDALRARHGTVARVTGWTVTVVAGDRIEVRATGEVTRVFGGALPGGARSITFHARATAQAVHA